MVVEVQNNNATSCEILLVVPHCGKGSPDSSAADGVEGLPPGMTKISEHAYDSAAAGRGTPPADGLQLGRRRPSDFCLVHAGDIPDHV